MKFRNLAHLLFLAALALVLVWMFLPKTDIVAPDWDVLITDAAGQPIPGAAVTVSSQQYTLERQSREEIKLSGSDGRVQFSGRNLKAIGLTRCIGVIRNLDQGVHASFGVHTYLSANKSGYGEPSELRLFGQNERESHANGSRKQSSHVVLQKCPVGYSGFGCDFPNDPTNPVRH